MGIISYRTQSVCRYAAHCGCLARCGGFHTNSQKAEFSIHDGAGYGWTTTSSIDL